jgi:hypothetical protein
MATTSIQSENEITSKAPVSGIDAQIVEASESPVGSCSREQGQPTLDKSDPVTEFELWLEQATAKELEEAEPKLEENVLGCHRNGNEWRLAMGGHLYRHHEVVRKRGTRDWTKWVTDTLDMGRTTAYDLMRAWTQEYGHCIDEHDEPDQANPKAEEIKVAIVKARERRKGRRRAPAAPALSGHVRVPWPEVFVTREACDRFKEAREQDEDGVRKLCRAAFYVVIGETDPESEPGADAGVVSVPAQVESEEATNDQTIN